MRKFLPFLILLVLLAGGVFIWRLTHPKLSDEEQIAANLDAICEAARNRSSRGITDYLAKHFKTGGIGKKDFQNSLVAGMLQVRVIDLQVSALSTEFYGQGAESTGNYVLSLKSEFDSPPQIQKGKFDLKWQKIDGEWKIVAADVPSLGQIGN